MTIVLTTPEPIALDRIAFLQSKGIDEDIASIDLEMVKMKMGEPEDQEGLGWSDEQLQDAEIEYKRYLMLSRNYPYPDYSIVPNKIMDTMWHFHILDTKAYVSDSDKVFGGYFHHYPYFGLRGEEDALQLKSSFEHTKSLYEKLFGEPMAHDGESKCTRNCKGRCWNACKSKGTS